MKSALVATARHGDVWAIRSEGFEKHWRGTGNCPLGASGSRFASVVMDRRFEQIPIVGLQEMLMSVLYVVLNLSPAAGSGFILYAEGGSPIIEFLFHEGGPAIYLLSRVDPPISFDDLGLDYSLSNAGFVGVQTLRLVSNTTSKRFPKATQLSKDLKRFTMMSEKLKELHKKLPLKTTLFYFDQPNGQLVTVDLANFPWQTIPNIERALH
jgi:hypothetical protein